MGNRLLVLTAAIVVGLLLQQVLSTRLTSIAEHAQQDRLAARAELAGLIRLVSTGVFGMTAALGVTVMFACRNPRAARCFPPPGLLSMGSRRALTGPIAQTMTRLGFGLGLALFVASITGVAFAWHIGTVLLACRA